MRTPGEHRFVGYAKIYFGRKGFLAALFIGLLETFFVLTVYLILAPSFSRLIFPGDYIYHFLIFWLLGSLAILFNTRRIALLEFLIVIGIISIIFLIGWLGFLNFSFLNILSIPDISKFLAVGPILFALAGSLVIPEVVSYFRESGVSLSYLKPSLVLGGILPAIAYAVFVFGILGLSGEVSEDAVSGLIGRLPPAILALIGILGFLSLISSYIAVGLNSRRIIEYDLSIAGWISRLSVIFIPIFLYFAGFQDFIGGVSFIGSLFFPLGRILINFLLLKADKKSGTPPILAGKLVKNSIPLLLLIFISALIYAII